MTKNYRTKVYIAARSATNMFMKVVPEIKNKRSNLFVRIAKNVKIVERTYGVGYCNKIHLWKVYNLQKVYKLWKNNIGTAQNV